jgi:hypothetical protein
VSSAEIQAVFELLCFGVTSLPGDSLELASWGEQGWPARV